jgi:cyclase
MSGRARPGASAVDAARAGAGPRSARGTTGLTARVIPCLDVAGGRVVKGVKFRNLRDQGDPAACALRYAEDGADEIVFLDITAAPERRATNLEWVTRTAEQVFIPLTVGGGVRSVQDGRALLLAGADKVGVNTAAVADPALLTRLAERFGSQCVVLSVDARRSPAHGSPARPDGEGARWEVVTHGGRTGTGMDVLAWITEGVERGAGEILLTSIDADGTQAGYDLELLAAVCARVNVPVVASGGAGSIDHLADALAAGASAILAASIFHESTYTPDQVKRELASRGFPMRLEKKV